MHKGILHLVPAILYSCFLVAQAPVSNVDHNDAAALKPSSPWPVAYSRRNFQLGISISQFRAAPYPDQKEWPGAYSVCTGDPRSLDPAFEVRLRISSDWKGAGVTACKFFYDSDVLKSPEEAGLVLGDINSRTTFFFISEDGRQEPRLFRIESGGPSGSYAELSNAFVSAYGVPSKASQEQYQTKGGSIFANKISTWENASSFIRLTQFGETTEVFEVVHSLKPLDKVFEKNLTEVTARKAKTL
jgi:hypothetical protein